MKIDSIRVGFIATNCYLLCDEEAGVCALIDPGDKPEQVPTWSAAPAAVWSTSC